MADTPTISQDPLGQPLTVEQRKQIEEGIADAEAGRVIPHAEVVRMIKERRKARNEKPIAADEIADLADAGEEAKLEAFRRAIDEGFEGPLLDGPTVMEELKERIRQRTLGDTTDPARYVDGKMSMEQLRAAIIEGEESGIAEDGVFERIISELHDSEGGK